MTCKIVGIFKKGNSKEKGLDEVFVRKNFVNHLKKFKFEHKQKINH